MSLLFYLSTHWGRSRLPMGGPHTKEGANIMTTKELRDNVTFLSALRMLEGMAERELLTEAEAERAKSELRRRLRPTLIFA